MSNEIGLFKAMHTQRAVRMFKPDPVSDEDVKLLIYSATKSPSGANSQPWKFIVIRDPELKRRIGGYYLESWEASYGTGAPVPPPIQTRIRASAAYLAEHMHEAPVLIMACIEHNGSPSTMSRGSSIYPAVQNILLAARGLGLGSVITTLHKRYEDEIKTLLGIPENVETAALLPIGHPTDEVRYGPTRRAPVDEVAFWDTWGTTATV
jgi:nitroreductase